MKIEIDLNEILGDEYGATESLAESIRRQVVEKLTSDLQKGISKKIDTEVSMAITAAITKSLDEITPRLLNELMDAEYVQVDRFGSRKSEPTTFRNELIKSINEKMVYKEEHYNSSENAFTKAVKGVISARVEEFKKEFNKTVDAGYVAQTLDYAVKTLKEKLKL